MASFHVNRSLRVAGEPNGLQKQRVPHSHMGRTRRGLTRSPRKGGENVSCVVVDKRVVHKVAGRQRVNEIWGNLGEIVEKWFRRFNPRGASKPDTPLS